MRTLFVDPHLPEWLPELRLTNLRVGDATVTLKFTRTKNGASSYTIENLRGTLHIVRQASPWSVTIGLGERLKDAGISLLPASSAGKKTAAIAGLAAGGALAWWTAKMIAPKSARS